MASERDRIVDDIMSELPGIITDKLTFQNFQVIRRIIGASLKKLFTKTEVEKIKQEAYYKGIFEGQRSKTDQLEKK